MDNTTFNTKHQGCRGGYHVPSGYCRDYPDNAREESILSKLDFLKVEDSLKVEKLIKSEITKAQEQLLDDLEVKIVEVHGIPSTAWFEAKRKEIRGE